MTSQGLEELDEAECYRLLLSRTLGRVGVHIASDLAIFPVYYAVMGRDIVLRTSPGTKLNAALLGTRVVFEIDDAADGWSVLVRGHAHEVLSHDEQTRAAQLLGGDWAPEPRKYYVTISAEQVTGRRVLAQR